ncbi:MAG TPA: phosphate ABC transporter substrate-binding protein [Hyphomicrobiales bacterium]|nr:phosphate ABC transporter substrate-binding protein [Hyphomicrobiales bacterium]
MYDKGHIRLTAMLGTYPKTAPLKSGTMRSSGFDFAFGDVNVAQKAFKDVVRDLKYDVAEIAIVTFLQAFAAGKPYVLLPFVMNGNFHHKSIWRRAADNITPADLAGRRVAMRSYSQTTPTWVRGILSDDYGLDVKAVEWLSQEGAHVAEYKDPPWVHHLDPGKKLEPMLLAGEVDAIIAGSGLSGDPAIVSMVPSPKEAALQWYARHHVVPINHMVSVRRELAEARPDLVKEIYELLRESRRSVEPGPPESGIDLQPSGYDVVAPAVEMITRFAYEQSLIPERYPVEALFGPVLEAVG